LGKHSTEEKKTNTQINDNNNKNKNNFIIIKLIVFRSEKKHKYLINNSIQFFIINVPSQQPQGQLQTHHCAEE
jgi:hypothetical protein